MQSFGKLFALLFAFLVLCSVSADDHPSVFYVLTKLQDGVLKGATLKGKTFRDLQTGDYSVEASGGVHNLLKSPLVFAGEECESGVITHILPTVQEGLVEGFGSRKTSGAATGTMVKYSLVVERDIMLHFMYSAPYDFDIHSNYLAVAACPTSSNECRGLTADHMYYNDYPFLRRKSFYDPERLDPVGICVDEKCLVGFMREDHHPLIYILALPKKYSDLDEKVRKRSGVSADLYAWLISKVIK